MRCSRPKGKGEARRWATRFPSWRQNRTDRVNRGGSGPHKWSNLPVVKRFREDHVTKGRQKKMPNRQVAVGIDDGQVHFSRAQGRADKGSPRILLAANIPGRRPTTAMTANPMDSTVGRISRVNGLAIRSADTICYGISRYCLLGVIAPKAEIRIFKIVLQSNLQILFYGRTFRYCSWEPPF